MHSLQSIAIPALVALSALVSAETLTGGLSGSPCPSDWTNVQYKDTQRCCYGSLTLESNDPYCCVHSFSLSNNYLDDTSSDCFPFCTGTTRELPTMTKFGASCQTKIAFITKDYSSLVSAASESVTGTTKSSDNDATTMTTTTGTGTETGAKSTAMDNKSETSTNKAGPVATAEGFALGGAAIAAAFLAL
ncbi:unnamed protein product [Penicillium pancosmium]